jgi:hypothetical protein
MVSILFVGTICAVSSIAAYVWNGIERQPQTAVQSTRVRDIMTMVQILGDPYGHPSTNSPKSYLSRAPMNS